MFKAGALLNGYKTLSDGTIRATFDFNEMSISQHNELSDVWLGNRFGWLLFAPEDREPTKDDVPDKSVGRDKRQTQSQELRYLITKLYQQRLDEGVISETTLPEDFYDSIMEKFKDQVKKKLKPEYFI
jgi:hypothetical protein